MILVIGGMGFIGLNTTIRLLEVGESVVITQHSSNRVPDAIKGEVGKRVLIERMDVTNAFEVMDVVRRHRPNGIISFAAPPPRGISPHADYQIYTSSLQNTLEAARAFEVKRVALASSQSVYGGLPGGPYREDALLPIDSRNQIEAFKKGMEIHALHYAERAGLEVVCLRIGSIYGPLYYSMFHPGARIAHAALKGEEPDFSDRPGGVIYEDDRADWVYVKDLVQGIQMLQTADKLNHSIYNVGSGRATSLKETYEAIKAVIPEAKAAALVPGATPNMPSEPVMDLSRITADTGYEPEHDVNSGFAEYIAWLRKNPQ
ncbi:MAG: NAD(P)-dependent oxidoreductase [Dehalococcoidia bacterium]